MSNKNPKPTDQEGQDCYDQFQRSDSLRETFDWYYRLKLHDDLRLNDLRMGIVLKHFKAILDWADEQLLRAPAKIEQEPQQTYTGLCPQCGFSIILRLKK